MATGMTGLFRTFLILSYYYYYYYYYNFIDTTNCEKQQQNQRPISVQFACNNYCIALLYSIIIIIINEICKKNNSFGFMFDLTLV